MLAKFVPPIVVICLAFMQERQLSPPGKWSKMLVVSWGQNALKVNSHVEICLPMWYWGQTFCDTQLLPPALGDWLQPPSPPPGASLSQPPVRWRLNTLVPLWNSQPPRQLACFPACRTWCCRHWGLVQVVKLNVAHPGFSCESPDPPVGHTLLAYKKPAHSRKTRGFLKNRIPARRLSFTPEWLRDYVGLCVTSVSQLKASDLFAHAVLSH